MKRITLSLLFFVVYSALPVWAGPPIRAEVTGSPQTVKLGQPFTLTYRIHAEPGVELTFPGDGSLNLPPWEVRYAVSLREGPEDYLYRMTLVSFSPGEQKVDLELPYTYGGETKFVHLPVSTLEVVSPLAGASDESLEIRPAKAPVEAIFPRELLLAGLGVGLFLSALLILLIKRWKRPQVKTPVELALDHLKSLYEAVESERWGTLYDGSALAIRRFLGEISGESLESRHSSEISGLFQDRMLEKLLREADAVKFAGEVPEKAQALQHLREAEQLILRYHENQKGEQEQ